MIGSRATCRWAAAAVLGICLLTASTSLTAQSGGRQRTLFVSALDKATKAPVESLKPADVQVKEDGVTREVLRVAPVTEPMQLALLVDNSTAATQQLVHLRAGLQKFVDAIGPRHEISLVTYADRPTLVTSFSADRAEIRKAVGRLFAQPGSGAYLLDALMETTQGFIKRQSPRPVIVAIDMEATEFSNQPYEAVLDRLEQSGAQLHVISLVDQGGDRTQEERYRSIVIDRGTRDTGGRRDNLLAGMALPDALTSLAAELNAQFSVVYARPDSLIPPRDTTVASATPALEVRGVLSRPKS